MMNYRILSITILLLSLLEAFAQPRVKVPINSDWEFVKSPAGSPDELDWGSAKVEKTDLPHTWNAEDVLDEIPGYYRGAGWYRKEVALEPGWMERRVFLEFEGANQVTEVFVDGKPAGKHEGGYTIFRFDITGFTEPGRDHFELCIRVDNSHNEDIPPLSADFTFFGGIYREAWLVYAPQVHFSLEHFGGDGVYWQTPVVNETEAKLKVFGFVTNYLDEERTVTIDHALLDGEGNEIRHISFDQTIAPGTNLSTGPSLLSIESPELWYPGSPVIYQLRSFITDKASGEVIDQITVPVGFRWFAFSADSGFFLNGEQMKIRGISRHQDHPGFGNALNREEHVHDIRLIKGMGANFLRVAHYPQDQDVLNLCDTMGLLASVEIPIVNRITESDAFTRNCMVMMQEMIWQNYNHPALIMWTYMNEVLLRPPFTDQPERLNIYTSNVEKLALRLEEIARELDPGRVTMIPNHGAMSRYVDAGLTQIPMVVGWNLYHGWYSNGFKGFGNFLDEHHALLPDKPILVTEYGAGHDPRLISADPERFDFSAEYAMDYHRAYVKEIEKRDFVSGGLIWILNDFSSEGRGDAVPQINNKGICDTDRNPKESYWYYKSQWCSDPFVKIWTPYPGMLVDLRGATQGMAQGLPEIKVFTNTDRVELFLNGQPAGEFFPETGFVEAGLPLVPGTNFLEAYHSDTGIKDTLSFQFLSMNGMEEAVPGNPGLYVSCGDNRYLFDKNRNELWVTDRPYTNGAWGYVGGQPFSVRTRHGVKPSSDQDILNTEIDPVFQTQRIGMDAYRFDVPPGSYNVSLLFSELSSEEELKETVYNLGDDAIGQEFEKRVFSVEINDNRVLNDFNIYKSSGSFSAMEKKFGVRVSGEEGILIRFIDGKGEPVISGIIVEQADKQ